MFFVQIISLRDQRKRKER